MDGDVKQMLLIEHLAVSALLFPSHAGPLASLPLACTGSEAAAGRPSRCGTSRTRSRRKVREGAFTKKNLSKTYFFPKTGNSAFHGCFSVCSLGRAELGNITHVLSALFLSSPLLLSIYGVPQNIEHIKIFLYLHWEISLFLSVVASKT